MKPIFFWPRRPLHQRDQLPKGPGLYAVVSMGRVLYVGRSTSLNRRWTAKGNRQHHRLPQAQDLLWPYLHYVELPERKITVAEQRLIRRVKPPWNNTKVPKHRWSLTELTILCHLNNYFFNSCNFLRIFLDRPAKALHLNVWLYFNNLIDYCTYLYLFVPFCQSPITI